MANVGRPSKIDVDSYLEAVRKCQSINDNDVASVLNLDRSNVYRFRKSNPDIEKDALDIINELANLEYKSTLDNYAIFVRTPIIKEWLENMEIDVSPKKRESYVKSFWHVCKYKRIHPAKITLEQCAEVVDEAKKAYYRKEKMPRGLAYTSIREGVRSFFSRIHKISREAMSQEGVTKEASLGQGKYAEQKVPQEVRHALEKTLKTYTVGQVEYEEMLWINKMGYYMGNRINATLEFSFSTHQFNLTKDRWMLEIIDKGSHKKGRKKWKKRLIGHALEDFKIYCSERFDIPIHELESKLPHKANYLFPLLHDQYNRVTNINKKALIDAGLQYRDFMPNHIMRHTFAQDGLKASNYNYELVASLGGWDNTSVLKKHYGKMDEEAEENGLKKMMGIPVKEIKTELRW